MENRDELIKNINARLDTISILNSFIDDGKTYYITLLQKNDGSITDTLRTLFEVNTWTFDITEQKESWKSILKSELLFYFGQYILQAKQPYLSKEYEGLKNEEFDAKNRGLILNSRTNVEFLLNTFLSDIGNLVGSDFTFFKVNVNWNTKDGYETWYECYQNDYLFDMGREILFLHFGGSD